MLDSHITIAIDGPSGSGKSTIARKLVQRLGILYLDTGAMYRTVGLKALRRGLRLDDEAHIAEMLANTDIDIRYRSGIQRMYLDGEDVTDIIRTSEVSNAASAVAMLKSVRTQLVEIQRGIARGSSVVMDGRDIGTHVLPEADLKIYLTASAQERARRRFDEWRQQGIETQKTLEQVEKEIEARDYQDMHREYSPLQCAADAVVIDSSHMQADEVVEAIMNLL